MTNKKTTFPVDLFFLWRPAPIHPWTRAGTRLATPSAARFPRTPSLPHGSDTTFPRTLHATAQRVQVQWHPEVSTTGTRTARADRRLNTGGGTACISCSVSWRTSLVWQAPNAPPSRIFLRLWFLNNHTRDYVTNQHSSRECVQPKLNPLFGKGGGVPVEPHSQPPPNDWPV